jgi:uncharacterized protein YbcI
MDAMNQADGSNPAAPDGLRGGELNSAVATAVVRVYRTYVGRGPTKAQAFYSRNLLVLLLEDTLTRQELTLASNGGAEAARQLRRQLQRTMREPLVGAIEELTACKVVALMGDNHIQPDLAMALFVLDRPIEAG